MLNWHEDHRRSIQIINKTEMIFSNWIGVYIILIHEVSSFHLQNNRNSLHRLKKATFRVTSTENSDAAFSAFAESIEEEELIVAEDYGSTKTRTWQESFESFLDPSSSLTKKQILLSELLNANDKIRDDIQLALRDRTIEPLLTPTGKRLQEGTKAVARQITTDIIPGIAAAASATSKGRGSPFNEELPTLVPKIGSRILDAVSNQARKQLELLQGDLANPSRIPKRITEQTAAVVTEAKNIFLETPEGLSGPKYTIVSKGNGYEIRDYEGYTVASTTMAKIGEPYSMDDLTRGGAAFNALAAYLFGANDEGRVMEMTTPVTTTSFGEMRFYLKKDGVTTASFPNPLSPASFNEKGAVQIMQVPPARLAAARFAGFATDGEVLRQKDALLSALAMDGIEVDVPHGSLVPHVVFQYNPPYTIPMIRRNEIAVPVVSTWTGQQDSFNESEDITDTGDDVSPSDG